MLTPGTVSAEVLPLNVSMGEQRYLLLHVLDLADEAASDRTGEATLRSAIKGDILMLTLILARLFCGGRFGFTAEFICRYSWAFSGGLFVGTGYHVYQ